MFKFNELLLDLNVLIIAYKSHTLITNCILYGQIRCLRHVYMNGNDTGCLLRSKTLCVLISRCFDVYIILLENYDP